MIPTSVVNPKLADAEAGMELAAGIYPRVSLIPEPPENLSGVPEM